MVATPPTSFVRVFACAGADDLREELRAIGVRDAVASAHTLAQAAVKVRVRSEWSAPIQRAVASLPSLTLFMPSQAGDAGHLLLLGPVHAVEACAKALSQPDNPAAPLARELLRQLQHIHPLRYGRLICRGRTLDFSARTGIMGILNVTPDSFSDGGLYMDPCAALDRAQQMLEEGADIIDIGGQSTRPGAEPVAEEEECRRVLPVIEAVAKAVPALLSVDTSRAGVARAALAAGVHMINDITALTGDPHLLGLVAEHQVPLILMHMQGTPRDMQFNPTYEALIDEVFSFLQGRLHAAHAGGIPEECLLIDPGIGFGKGTGHNLEILRKLHHFRALGRPIVVGTSRKAFIGRILGTGVDERLEGTAATVAQAIAQGAAIIRVHDVQAMARVARMMDAIVRPGFARQERGGKSGASHAAWG